MPSPVEQTQTSRLKARHRASARALLRTEVENLRALQATFRASMMAIEATGAELDGATLSLAALLSRAILQTRRRARDASYRTMLRELAELTDEVPGAVGTSAGDVTRANYAGRSLANRWRRAVRTALEAGEQSRRAKTLAAAAVASHLEMIATTETATAYSEERTAALRRVEPRQERAGSVVLLVEFWNAVLDRRTCQTCEQMDGEWRVFGIGWDDGGPGLAHPRCRCMSSLGAIVAPFQQEVAA